jgi:hypothetical protein
MPCSMCRGERRARALTHAGLACSLKELGVVTGDLVTFAPVLAGDTQALDNSG